MVSENDHKGEEEKETNQNSTASTTKKSFTRNWTADIPCTKLNELLCCQKLAQSVLFYVLIFTLLLVLVYIIRKLVSLPNGNTKYPSRKPSPSTSVTTGQRNPKNKSLSEGWPVKLPRIQGNSMTSPPTFLRSTFKTSTYHTITPIDNEITSVEKAANIKNGNISYNNSNEGTIGRNQETSNRRKLYLSSLKNLLGKAERNIEKNHGALENSDFRFQSHNANNENKEINSKSSIFRAPEKSGFTTDESAWPAWDSLGRNNVGQSNSNWDYAGNSIPWDTTSSLPTWSKSGQQDFGWENTHSNFNYNTWKSPSFSWVNFDQPQSEFRWPNTAQTADFYKASNSQNSGNLYNDHASKNSVYNTQEANDHNSGSSFQKFYGRNDYSSTTNGESNEQIWNPFNSYLDRSQAYEWNDFNSWKTNEKSRREKQYSRNHESLSNTNIRVRHPNHSNSAAEDENEGKREKANTSSKKDDEDALHENNFKASRKTGNSERREERKKNYGKRKTSKRVRNSESRLDGTLIPKQTKRKDLLNHTKKHTKAKRARKWRKKLKKSRIPRPTLSQSNTKEKSKVSRSKEKQKKAKTRNRGVHTKPQSRKEKGKRNYKNSKEKFQHRILHKNKLLNERKVAERWQRKMHSVKNCKELRHLNANGKVQLHSKYLPKKRQYKYTVLFCRIIHKRHPGLRNNDEEYNDKKQPLTRKKICQTLWFITNGKILLKQKAPDNGGYSYAIVLCRGSGMNRDVHSNEIKTSKNYNRKTIASIKNDNQKNVNHRITATKHRHVIIISSIDHSRNGDKKPRQRKRKIHTLVKGKEKKFNEVDIDVDADTDEDMDGATNSNADLDENGLEDKSKERKQNDDGKCESNFDNNDAESDESEVSPKEKGKGIEEGDNLKIFSDNTLDDRISSGNENFDDDDNDDLDMVLQDNRKQKPFKNSHVEEFNKNKNFNVLAERKNAKLEYDDDDDDDVDDDDDDIVKDLSEKTHAEKSNRRLGTFKNAEDKVLDKNMNENDLAQRKNTELDYDDDADDFDDNLETGLSKKTHTEKGNRRLGTFKNAKDKVFNKNMNAKDWAQRKTSELDRNESDFDTNINANDDGLDETTDTLNAVDDHDKGTESHEKHLNSKTEYLIPKSSSADIYSDGLDDDYLDDAPLDHDLDDSIDDEGTDDLETSPGTGVKPVIPLTTKVGGKLSQKYKLRKPVIGNERQQNKKAAEDKSSIYESLLKQLIKDEEKAMQNKAHKALIGTMLKIKHTSAKKLKQSDPWILVGNSQGKVSRNMASTRKKKVTAKPNRSQKKNKITNRLKNFGSILSLPHRQSGQINRSKKRYRLLQIAPSNASMDKIFKKFYPSLLSKLPSLFQSTPVPNAKSPTSTTPNPNPSAQFANMLKNFEIQNSSKSLTSIAFNKSVATDNREMNNDKVGKFKSPTKLLASTYAGEKHLVPSPHQVGQNDLLSLNPSDQKEASNQLTNSQRSVIATVSPQLTEQYPQSNPTLISQASPNYANGQYGYPSYSSSYGNTYLSYDKQPLTNILCFGDSLTSGYYNHGRGKHPYSLRLDQLLNPTGSRQYNIVTRGIVGEMVHGSMTKRLPEVLNEGTKFDWVIILGGTNDVAHVKNFGDDEDFTQQLISVWSPKIVKDIEKLHEVSRLQGARTVLITIPETAYELWPEFRSIRNMRLSVNAALRKYATEVRDTTVLCDLAYKLPRSSLSKQLQKYFWNDHIHLNPVGYDKMAEIIEQCIRPYLTK